MNLNDKIKKLLEFSVILKSQEKKSWFDLLPQMSEKQSQTLYQVLIDEVKAWKKEGISIVEDPQLEHELLPSPSAPVHGTSLDELKQRLEAKSKPADPFTAHLKAQVGTPELKEHQHTPEELEREAKLTRQRHDVTIQPKAATTAPGQDNRPAWMISQNVVAPKSKPSVIAPHRLHVPKPRSRVARHGLGMLDHIDSIDDLSRIEPAHLRQGALQDQVRRIRDKIAALAVANDVLPISIIPIFEQSPLFQLYIKAGSMLIDRNLMSPETKTSMDEIMSDLEAMGEETLSDDEFAAVADLKKELETMSGQ